MVAKQKPLELSFSFFDRNQDHILVYSDTLCASGLMDKNILSLSNVYKFVTEKEIGEGFIIAYKPKQYVEVLEAELSKLVAEIMAFRDHVFVIPPLYGESTFIFTRLILPHLISKLGNCKNVWFAW